MTDPTPEPVIALRGVSIGYTDRAVVHDVNLVVQRGEVVAVLGANGSGKTTLVRGLLGLARILTGEVELLGRPVGARGRSRWHGARIGYVPQRHTVGGTVASTVREVVSSGRLPRLGRVGWMREADRAAVTAAIDAVDLSPWADVDIADLSGGQQRRALIARALASEPEVLIMDEPTAGVDQASQQALADALGVLKARGATIVLVAHELGPMQPLIDRVIVMRDGRIASAGPSLSGADAHAHAHHHPVLASHDHVPHVGSPLDELGGAR